MTTAIVDVRNMLAERTKCVTEARRIESEAKNACRELTAEERGESDRLLDRATELTRLVEADRKDRSAGRFGNDGARADGRPFRVKWKSRDRRNMNRRREIQVGTGDRATGEYRDAFARYLRTGRMAHQADGVLNALQSDSDTSGGYLQPPEQFVAQLIKALDARVFVRQMARTFAVPEAKSLGASKRTQKTNTFGWTAEVQAPSADASLKFGKRILYPHHLTGSIVVSRDLLRGSGAADEIVRDELARDAGEKQEQAFIVGSGVKQPLGLFVPSSDGISTARDISTGNTTTNPTFDGLMAAKYALRPSYWPTSQWMFHPDAVRLIAGLKDTTGNYLWRQSLLVGEPDQVLGLPMNVSEFIPNTFTTGQYVGIIGDFNFYYIADGLDMEIQRLDELSAHTNQVELIGRLKTDGMPVLEEAFARVTLA